jgi:hypothetical protein
MGDHLTVFSLTAGGIVILKGLLIPGVVKL